MGACNIPQTPYKLKSNIIYSKCFSNNQLYLTNLTSFSLAHKTEHLTRHCQQKILHKIIIQIEISFLFGLITNAYEAGSESEDASVHTNRSSFLIIGQLSSLHVKCTPKQKFTKIYYIYLTITTRNIDVKCIIKHALVIGCKEIDKINASLYKKQLYGEARRLKHARKQKCFGFLQFQFLTSFGSTSKPIQTSSERHIGAKLKQMTDIEAT
ncbi:hypothetical protein GQX74_009043 [Glossina fuscipes]|nr:hypothetical protein GQX74_009043 [Glossina fuscipes]